MLGVRFFQLDKMFRAFYAFGLDCKNSLTGLGSLVKLNSKQA